MNASAKKALAALLLALALLGGLELAHPRLPWLRERFRNTHFLKSPTLSQGGPSLGAGEADATGLAEIRALFKELAEGKRKRIRVAYFADSISEGDVLTEGLRAALQGAYGGKGLGLQGLAPRDFSYRLNILIQPSGGWERRDLHDLRKEDGLNLGPGGELARVKTEAGRAETRYQAPAAFPGSLGDVARLFYGPGSSDLQVKAGGKLRTRRLRGTRLFNVASLPAPGSALQLRVDPDRPGMPFYGVSFESETGVLLDNLSLRGNTGEGLAKLNPRTLRAAQQALGWDLVIVHFGLNALTVQGTDHRWYENGLRKSLQHLKANLPGARFAVIGVCDRAVRREGVWGSDPEIPGVIGAQRRAAKAEGAWFFDLYQAMGGAGTMKAWAEASPSLANKDYTHVNRRGGERLAAMIREAMLGPLPAPALDHASR